jgi:DNA transposition AAA+ family ATPase
VDLGHLEKEFEKVHDELPILLSRVAVTEEWQRAHPETHRLEAAALALANAAIAAKLHDMNELRKQIDTERGTFITREFYDREHQRIREEISDLRSSRDQGAGEQSFLERFWPLFVAVGIVILQHFWK